MNQNPHDPTTPDPENAAWEEAMSRDFDARVRDLHEAPLDLDSVKGKAHRIRRNRRAAVAGGILGVAAIVTPIAVLANDDGGARSREPDFAPQTTESPSVPPVDAEALDYISNGLYWHQSDGEVVQLPENDQPYDAAVLWNGQLVATRWDGEVYSIADVIDDEGQVVDSFPTAGSVVVNDAGTTIAWVDTDGDVMTRWPGDQVSLGTVDLAAPGEAIAWSAAAITGGPDCHEEADGCLVYINSALGEESLVYSSHGIVDAAAPGATKVFDARADGSVSVINDVTEDLDTCGGLYDPQTGKYRWETCDFQVQEISPDGAYVAAPPSQYDGLGPTSISVLDTVSHEETGIYSAEGGFIATWTWSADGNLLFDTFDGAKWHLFAMTPAGAAVEIGEPVKGEDFDSPFTLVRH